MEKGKRKQKMGPWTTVHKQPIQRIIKPGEASG
jgi:hypothetical protein